MNNGFSRAHDFEDVIQRLRKVIKKLEEIKIKVGDLRIAKKELFDLIKNLREEILSGLIVLEDSSDSD